MQAHDFRRTRRRSPHAVELEGTYARVHFAWVSVLLCGLDVVAHFLKDSGLLAAGVEYLTLGGMGYAEHGDRARLSEHPEAKHHAKCHIACGRRRGGPARCISRVPEH